MRGTKAAWSAKLLVSDEMPRRDATRKEKISKRGSYRSASCVAMDCLSRAGFLRVYASLENPCAANRFVGDCGLYNSAATRKETGLDS